MHDQYDRMDYGMFLIPSKSNLSVLIESGCAKSSLISFSIDFTLNRIVWTAIWSYARGGLVLSLKQFLNQLPLLNIFYAYHDNFVIIEMYDIYVIKNANSPEHFFGPSSCLSPYCATLS